MGVILESNKLEFRNNVLRYKNYSFYLMDSLGGLAIEELGEYSAILLEANDPDFTKIVIKRFRSHNNPEFYLKPIFLIHYKPTNDPIINNLHDGIIASYEQLPEKTKEIQQIITLTTHLDNSPSNTFDVFLMKKVLNYMYTREYRQLTPYPDIHSIIGFTYPIVSVNFEAHEEMRVLDFFDWALKEHIIWPDFYDRIYLCNSCGSGHLSYREICPSCDSANMKSEDLIHHFPCGFIGPISDFKNSIDSVLNCPKCSKALRHIGVDYDKPSIINHCQNCNEVFQDYLVKARCFKCGSDSDVQYLMSRNINVFKLTKKGRSAAASGIITSEYTAEEEIFGAVNNKTFNVMMHYEQERLKHTKGISTNIAVLYVENIYDLLRKIGKSKEKAFIIELVQLIRENITPADFINISNPSLIVICINDTNKTDAETIAMKVTNIVEEMVFNNFNKLELLISFKVFELSTAVPFEKQLLDVTKSFTEQND